MSEPLWKDEFSVQLADERYVTRRQFTKFLTLTSLGMFAGNPHGEAVAEGDRADVHG